MRKVVFIYVVILGFISQVNAQPNHPELKRADSLYFAQDWTNARQAYLAVLKDTSHNSIALNRLGFSEYNTGHYSEAMADFKKSLANKPIPAVKGSVYSRMARISAMQNNTEAAISNIDSAVTYGYVSFSELDTLKEFNTLRNDAGFKKARERIFLAANPCMGDPKAREFDFWVGRWNVYPTGTQTLVGHSLVQIVSGGCALLENWEALGNASSGKSLNFIDGNHLWRQCWIGSYPNGQQDFVSGEYKDGAMRFTFTTTDAKGNKLMGRFIFFNEGPDKVRQFNETSADEGKTWTTAYDLTYIRVKE